MGKIEGRRFFPEHPPLCPVHPGRPIHRMEADAHSCPVDKKLGVERGCSPRTGSGQVRRKQEKA